MAADLNKPDTTLSDTAVLTAVRENDAELAKQSGSLANLVAGVIRFTANKWDVWSGSAWGALSTLYDINVDRHDGYDAGNASGNIPVSNGTLNTNLNADKLDGKDAGTGADQVLLLDGSGKVPIANLPTTGIAASTYKSLTIDVYGRATAGTNPTTLAGYGIADAAALAGSTSQAFSIADATARTQAARWGQVQDDATSSAATSGTDTYTATLSPVITAYATNHVYWLQFANANTSTTPTVNLNAIAAKTIKRQDGSALRAGDLSGWHGLLYNGTDMLLLNPAPRAAFGKQTIFVPASAMIPSVSSGCAALATVAGAANQPDRSTCDFDPTTQEFAQFAVAMPKSWNEGTVTFAAIWSHPSTATNFGVAWQLEGVAISDADSFAATFGTAVVATDTGGTTDAIYITPESGAVTIAGTLVAGDLVQFRLGRAPANGSDTMAVDARLHGIRVYLTTDTETDA
jgi:hypothetical protein